MSAPLPSLDAALAAEAHISAPHMTSRAIGSRLIAIAAAAFPEMLHWNAAYCLEAQRPLSADELAQLRAWYAEQGVLQPRIRLPVDDTLPGHESEYLALSSAQAQHITPRSARGGILTLDVIDDVATFTGIVRDAFGLREDVRIFLTLLLAAIAQKREVRNFVARFDGAFCGSSSLIRTDDDCDFLMNVGIVPAFQSAGAASAMLTQLTAGSPRTILVQSDNARMRTTLLPSLGFASLGATRLVALAALPADGRHEA